MQGLQIHQLTIPLGGSSQVNEPQEAVTLALAERVCRPVGLGVRGVSTSAVELPKVS